MSRPQQTTPPPRNEHEETLLRLLEAVRTSGQDYDPEAAPGVVFLLGDPAYREIVTEVLDRACWWSPGPKPKGVRKRADKQCFGNCQLLAVDRGWSYVEGYAVAEDGFAVHHAWCGDEVGRAIDPTWEKPGVAYFGVAFSPKEVAGRLLKAKASGGSMLVPDES